MKKRNKVLAGLIILTLVLSILGVFVNTDIIEEEEEWIQYAGGELNNNFIYFEDEMYYDSSYKIALADDVEKLDSFEITLQSTPIDARKKRYPKMKNSASGLKEGTKVYYNDEYVFAKLDPEINLYTIFQKEPEDEYIPLETIRDEYFVLRFDEDESGRDYEAVHISDKKVVKSSIDFYKEYGLTTSSEEMGFTVIIAGKDKDDIVYDTFKGIISEEYGFYAQEPEEGNWFFADFVDEVDMEGLLNGEK